MYILGHPRIGKRTSGISGIFTNAFPSDYVEPDRTDCDHLHDVITTNKIRALGTEIRGLSVGFGLSN